MREWEEAEDEAAEGEGHQDALSAGDALPAAPDVWFYPLPIWQLIAFGLAGGGFFQVYWSYRCWSAYRAAWGYSRGEFWRSVYAATGYRISPFLRSLLGLNYALFLFPAVERECRAACVRGARAPVAFALCAAVLGMLGLAHHGGLAASLLSPIWAVIPVQLAVNRLNERAGRRIAFRANGLELLLVALGAFLKWR
jgi:hypothetical protein